MKNKSVNHICSIVLVCVFFAMIVTPLLLINKDESKLSRLENKKLTPLPNLFVDGGKVNTSFLSQFGSYAEENIGLKYQAVILEKVTIWSVFHYFNLMDCFTGKDGHLFYSNEETEIKQYQGKILLSEEALKNAANNIVDLKNYFENQDIPFVMLSIPNKENVYPEFYPDSIIRFSENTMMDLLVLYLEEHTDVDIIGLKKALSENKENEILYYKSYDPTHWNYNGAFLGYRHLMEHLQKRLGDIKILDKADFDIKAMTLNEASESVPGYAENVTGFMEISDFLFDDDYYYYSMKSKISDPVRQYNVNIPAYSGYPLKLYMQYSNPNNTDGKRLLIFGDSYVYSFMLDWLSESFSEVYFVHQTYVKNYDAVAATEYLKPDAVVYESVERAEDLTFNKLEDFKYLTPFKSDEFRYEDLPEVNGDVTAAFDSPILTDNGMEINLDAPVQEIYGWCVDNNALKPYGDVYLKVGDYYYRAQRTECPDLAQGLNLNYLNAGFVFKIPTARMIESGNALLIVISSDLSYKYKPFEVKIKK